MEPATHCADGTAAVPFFTNLKRMVEQFSSIFPKCEMTAEKVRTFDTYAGTPGIAKLVIEAWHEKLREVYDRCRSKDRTVVEHMCSKIEMLQEIDLMGKTTKFSEDDWHVFWLFVNTLNRYASMYYNLPEGFTGVLQAHADEGRAAIGSNDMDAFVAIGRKIVDKLDASQRLTVRRGLGTTFVALGGMDGLQTRFT